MKKKTLVPIIVILVLLLGTICLEERKPYEILNSTVLSSPNLTEHKITLAVHSLLPIDQKELAKEVTKDLMRLNSEQPNPYFELEVYRTKIHYHWNLIYDIILCNRYGEIVDKIELSD